MKKRGKSGKNGRPRAVSRRAGGMALVASLVMVSCAPVMEPAGFEKTGDTWEIPDGTYLTLRPVEEEAAGPSSGARSLTWDEQDSLWNYFEIIAKKVYYRSGGQEGLPVDGNPWYSIRGNRKQGWVSIPVDEGYMYDVLLLEGYQGKSGDPVLLRTAFVRTDYMVEGENQSPVSYQRVLVQPSDTSDDNAGMKIFLTDADQGSGIRPGYMGDDAPLFLSLAPYSADAAYLPDAKVRMAIDGILPLIQAKAPAASSTTLLGVTFNEFFASGSLVREKVEDGEKLFRPWRGDAANVDIGDIDGRALVTWDLAGKVNEFLPPFGGVANLYFELKYYGFSETPVPGNASPDPDTAVAMNSFTRWAIRNGLNNDNLDKQNSNGSVSAGGMLAVVIGDGGTSTSSAWVPLGEDGYLFSRPPRIRVTVGSGGRIDYEIIPSYPAAAKYDIYWTQMENDDVDVDVDALGVWNKENIDLCSADNTMTGTFNVNGAVDDFYTLMVTAKEPKYTKLQGARWAVTVFVDTAAYIDVAGTVGAGIGWRYEGGIYTILNGSQTYRIYSSTGADLNRGIVVSENCTDVVLEMMDDPANADPAPKPIQLNGAAPLSIGLDSAVKIVLKDGVTVKLTAGSGTVGLNVPKSGSAVTARKASVTIEEGDGGGTLEVYGGSAHPAIGGHGYYGDITIKSGNIIAVGGFEAAAIGNSTWGSSDRPDGSYTWQGTIRIEGGRVDARVSEPDGGRSAVIGAGRYTSCGMVQITGGYIALNLSTRSNLLAAMAIGGYDGVDSFNPYERRRSGAITLDGDAFIDVIGGTNQIGPFSCNSAGGSNWNKGIVRLQRLNTVTVYGSAELPEALFDAAGIFTNAGGVLTLSGTTTIFDGAATSAAGAVVTIPAGKTLVNGGIVNANGGALALDGTLTNANGWLNLPAGSTVTSAVTEGVVVTAGAGEVHGSRVTLAVSPVIKPAETLLVPAGATLTIGGGRTLTNTGVITAAGTITGTLSNVNGIIYRLGGTIPNVTQGIVFVDGFTGSVKSNTTLGNGQMLTINPDAALTIPAGVTLTAGAGSLIMGAAAPPAPPAATGVIRSAGGSLNLGTITLGGYGTLDFTPGGVYLPPEMSSPQYGQWTWITP